MSNPFDPIEIPLSKLTEMKAKCYTGDFSVPGTPKSIAVSSESSGLFATVVYPSGVILEYKIIYD